MVVIWASRWRSGWRWCSSLFSSEDARARALSASPSTVGGAIVSWCRSDAVSHRPSVLMGTSAPWSAFSLAWIIVGPSCSDRRIVSAAILSSGAHVLRIANAQITSWSRRGAELSPGHLAIRPDSSAGGLKYPGTVPIMWSSSNEHRRTNRLPARLQGTSVERRARTSDLLSTAPRTPCKERARRRHSPGHWAMRPPGCRSPRRQCRW
jgi:hypothetical protein